MHHAVIKQIVGADHINEGRPATGPAGSGYGSGRQLRRPVLQPQRSTPMASFSIARSNRGMAMPIFRSKLLG